MISAVLEDQAAQSAVATPPGEQDQLQESADLGDLDLGVLESALVALPLSDTVRSFLLVATGVLLSQSLCVYEHMMSAMRRPASPHDRAAAAPEAMGDKAALSSKRSKLNRSISSSSVTEASISSSWPGPRSTYFTRSMAVAERCRTISTMEDTIKRRHTPMEVEYSCVADAKQYMKAGKFPFRSLNKDCKLKIFSMLSAQERGVAAQVCTEWHALMRVPSLWHTVDCRSFTMCARANTKGHQCSKVCYLQYRHRMQAFHRYLIEVRPVIRRWSWSFDIADYDDGYFSLLTELLRNARLQELGEVHMNWAETPKKPFLDAHQTWTTADYNDFNHRQRSRRRKFLNMLDMMTAAAPQLRALQTPWEFSDRAALYLSRLRDLRTLKLQKYMLFRTLEQDQLDKLLQATPRLHSLVLEVTSASAKTTVMYTLCAPALVHLDISQSQGFGLQEVDLPSLEEFHVHRRPWNGPMVTANEFPPPCLYDVLASGAPRLRQLNGHVLLPDWRHLGAEHLYEDLERLLNGVCPCRRHNAGWAM